MKRTYKAVGAVVALLVAIAVAEEYRSPVVFKSDVDFDTGANLKIQGTKVTSTAAELNIMDGVTATADEINAAADQSARVTTATVADNGSVTLSASTPYVIITGTGQALNASCDIAFTQPFPASGEWTVMCAYGSTNYICFSNITSQVIGDTTTLRPGEAVKLFAQATNKLCLSGQGVITSNRLAAADFGAFTVAAGGGVSIDSDGLPATVTSVTTLSNDTAKVYGARVEVASSGALVVNSSATVTVPAGSIAAASIASGTLPVGVKRCYSVTTQNIANAGSIVPAPDTVFYLTPTGMALDAAATITLGSVAPSYSGSAFQFWIANTGAATGTIAVAQSGTFYGIPLSISTGQVASCWMLGETNKFYGR